MIRMRHDQPTLWEGLLAEEVADLWDWQAWRLTMYRTLLVLACVLSQAFAQTPFVLHVSAAHQNEVSESNLDLAEQLWQARKKECKSPPATDGPLALVLAKLAQ